MWEIINYILSIIGIISLIVTLVRIIWTFSGNTEWLDNIKIEEHPMKYSVEGNKGLYPQYYPCSPDEFQSEPAAQTLFIPQNSIIKKVALKQIVLSSVYEGKEKYKTVHVFKDVTPLTPICLVAERRQAIPEYLLEWKTEYGAHAVYYFYDDLYSSRNNQKGFEYTFGFWAKVRKVLGLK